MPADQEAQPRLLSGWGRTAPTRAAVLAPETLGQLEAALQSADGRGVLPRGLGRSYGDAAQNAGGLVLDMTALHSVHAFDVEAGEIVVDAGMSLDELIRLALPFGWFPAVTPGTRHVTIGGAIAADVHGKNHHVDGSFCRHVRTFDLLTPEGLRRDVSAESEPDAFWATAGGMGLTGVVTRATLALTRVQTSEIVVDTERAADLDDLMDRMRRGDTGYRYSVAWIDCLARGRRLGRAVLMSGDHATADDLPAARRGKPLRVPAPARLRVPPGVPPGLLRPATVRAFNEAYFRAAPRERRGALESIGHFFHPLDAVADWNRGYGPRGFLQYQLVVPESRDDALRAVLERLSSSGQASFLAVFKRLGAGNGLLSFPAPGWTLTLDLPAGVAGLAELLDGCDELVAGAGGRVYLAKDSRLRPELLETMYPELPRWRELRDALDPRRRLRSDLDRRVGLTGAPA